MIVVSQIQNLISVNQSMYISEASDLQCKFVKTNANLFTSHKIQPVMIFCIGDDFFVSLRTLKKQINSTWAST